ncbi:hypothetical protein GCM10008967_28080 [Bacillus carboniphilus]|uniref:DUF1146 domain-containing protein n=1 Tax=Bacillus carboniphilus TaxID=86663 RepID=A0ABN0WFP9_9BACI
MLTVMILFGIFGYSFILSLVKTIKKDEDHHQYGLRKHFTAILFVIWSFTLLLILAQYTENQIFNLLTLLN